MDPGAEQQLPESATEPAVEPAARPSGKYSDFIVYVDESGDHGMATLDPNYPVFVLAFCVFYKRHYTDKVVPALHRFKFGHFGHDLVVLHEHEIRKEKGAFKFQSRAHREQFQDELTDEYLSVTLKRDEGDSDVRTITLEAHGDRAMELSHLIDKAVQDELA